MFDKGKLYPDNNFSKHYIIDQHRKSLFNWTNASKHGICPKLKYWGFVKSTSIIKNCNELFDILFERCFIFSPKRDVYNSKTRGGKKKKSTKRKTKKSKVNK